VQTYLFQTLFSMNNKGTVKELLEGSCDGGETSHGLAKVEMCYSGTPSYEYVRFTVKDGYVTFRGKRRKIERQIGGEFIRQPGESMDDFWKKALKFAQAEYKKRRQHDTRHPSYTASVALSVTERCFPELKTHGVEGFALDAGGRDGLTYLNTGDSYDTTILFRSRSERMWLGSWGDFVESNPKLCGNG
jgi:hypothetical protein